MKTLIHLDSGVVAFFCILCRVLVCCPQTLSSRHKNLLSHSHKKFLCLCDRSTFFSLLTSNYLNTTIFCITRTTTQKTLTETLQQLGQCWAIVTRQNHHLICFPKHFQFHFHFAWCPLLLCKLFFLIQ